MVGKFLNLSLDTSLGGDDASDYKAVSQKAIKSYIDTTVKGISDEVGELSKSVGDISPAIQSLTERIIALEELIVKCYISED